MPTEPSPNRPNGAHAPPDDAPWPSDEDAGNTPSSDDAQPSGSPQEPSVDGAWKTLGAWAVLTTTPPPRKWLLTRPDDDTNGETSTGVLQMGKVGLLVAAGGAGKTYVLIELALAVATGRKWLDFFGTPNPGRVLIALAEEDHEELQRRFYYLAQAMRLTAEQLQLAHERIVALPLAGQPVGLVESDGRNTVEGATLQEFRRKLGESVWRLVILDPLSRFAGADTEKDNAAATRYIQAVESLVNVPGSPAVLVAHHTNKLSRSDGSRASASNARGSTAITDGARWVAELESLGDDGARLTVTKSNYGKLGAPVELVRDDGYLRIATREEARQRAEARDAAKVQEDSARVSALLNRICEWLAEHPDRSKSALARDLRARDRDVGLAVDELLRTNRIARSSRHGHSLVQPSSATEDAGSPAGEV